MKIEVEGGTITVPAGTLTPREVTRLIRDLKKAVQDVKKTHCQNGHFRTETNWEWKLLPSGYMIRRCLTCRAKWEDKYYAEKTPLLRQQALARYYRRRGEQGYACTPCK